MRRWLCSIAWLLLAGGCAQAPVVPPAVPVAMFHDALFKPPSQAVRPADAMAASPAMREYAHRELWRMKLKDAPFGLVDGLLDSGTLKLEYDSEMTRNAAEAFEARTGNCLSLVMMTASLAREMGLRVIYRQVETGGVWSRSGTLQMDLAHVNISIARERTGSQAVNLNGDWVTIDFMASAAPAKARTWQLEESRILGMYLVNRSVEHMAAGRMDDAYWHARAAIEVDPGYADAYNTLGVVYQRHGRPREAEAALRHTIAMEPTHRHAIGNLVGVLDSMGRTEDAAVARAEWRRIDPVPPFQDYDEGLRAMQAGDYARARQLFERELRRHAVQFHELHLNLARVYLRAGNLGAAREQLEKALEFSTTRQQHALYSAKLELLKEERARLRR